MDLYELNNVSVFLYPLLEIPADTFNKSYVNSYLSDDEVDLYKDNHLFLMYREDNNEDLIKQLKDHNLYKNTYKISDNRVVVFDFKRSEHWRDYLIFRKGKYSLMSQSAKDLVLTQKYNFYQYLQVVKDAFVKAEAFRNYKSKFLGVDLASDAELWSIYSQDKDILNKSIRQASTNPVEV